MWTVKQFIQGCCVHIWYWGLNQQGWSAKVKMDVKWEKTGHAGIFRRSRKGQRWMEPGRSLMASQPPWCKGPAGTVGALCQRAKHTADAGVGEGIEETGQKPRGVGRVSAPPQPGERHPEHQLPQQRAPQTHLLSIKDNIAADSFLTSSFTQSVSWGLHYAEKKTLENVVPT